MGTEEKGKSRDLSNRSLKTDRGTEIGELHRDFSKEREGKKGGEQEQRSEEQVSEDRQEYREQRTT